MSSNYGDEDDFMNNLLADMDESLLRTPTKTTPLPPTSRNIQKPIVKPDFSQKSKNSDMKQALSDSSAIPNKPILKSAITFTPEIPDPKKRFITRLPDGTLLLDVDPIEESSVPLTLEEVRSLAFLSSA